MAVVAVTATNTRVEDSEATTGWSNRGGGAGVAAEPALAYQGTNTVNRKVTSSTGAGFEYDPVSDSGSAQDMTGAAKAHWMVKCIVSDPGGLRSNDGVRIIIGDGSNEYAFIVAGTDSIKSSYDSYLLRTATIIIPVNPNISGYRDSTHSSGTVTLTAVDQFGIDAEFATASAKSENVGLDAIDLGTGLTLVGGDGGSTDGVWTDFVDEDEGTTSNRWGFANSLYGAVNFFFGTMTIGSATATEFVDLTAINLWPDGLFEAGFSNVVADLQNASTIITDGSTHTSLGTTVTEDTRADWAWSGTSGTGTASHTLNNFRNYVMTSAVTLDGANIEIADLTQGSGTITDSTIRCNSASGVAVCNDADFTKLDGIAFIQTGSGHAIEITSTGTYTLDALTFSGFGADASNAAAIYNNSGGAVTLNVDSTPTVRNGTGASTTIVANPVTTQITVKDVQTGLAIENARVYILADSGGPSPHEASVTITRSGTTATVTHTAHGYATSDEVLIAGANQNEYNGVKTITVTGANTYTYTVTGSPTTPATGTIEATTVIINGLTNASGVISDIRALASAQPIIGRVRKSSASPYYKTSPIAGSISNTAGFSVTVQMIPDE